MNKEQSSQKYLGGREASKLLGVHQRTLYNWDEYKKIETIRTPGNKRLYNVQKFLEERNCNTEKCDENLDKLDEIKGKLNIAYVRVSSVGQKNDLVHQENLIIEKYPKHYLIKDIGSGINLNRRGFMKIIHLAINGKINEFVVVHKDRLTRFGYELVENLIKIYSKGEIKIIKQKKDIEPEEELVSDIMQLMNVFVARMNGLRKYKKNKEKIENDTDSDI
jgi:predicted site-specific integrase-resolvase